MPETTITRAPDYQRYSLRFSPEIPGVPAPSALGQAVAEGDRIALGLGPDEWLILARAASGPLPPPQIAAAFSWVDITARQIGLTVTGPGAEKVLNIGCPLDLSLTGFAVDTCTRTLIGKAEVIVWRRAPDQFHVEVWRSFVAYVEGLLGAAASETL